MSQDIHAPYHFVPLSKWIHYPSWGNQVSHDVPFSEGYSGKIEYTLSNMTRLCVGGEQSSDGNVCWSENPSGELIIPGSSLKGMIRSSLEIASFSKMNNVDDGNYAIREFPKNDKDNPLDAHSYWLKYNSTESKWQLFRTDHTVIFHDDLNQEKLVNHINSSKHGYLAIDSYKAFANNNITKLRFNLKKREFPIEEAGYTFKQVGCANIANNGKFTGTPVFSSYRPIVKPSDKTNGKLKKPSPTDKKTCETRSAFSYIFYGEDNYQDAVNTVEKGFSDAEFQTLVTQFFQTHSKPDHEKDKCLIRYLKNNKAYDYKIPVFCLENNGKILSLGTTKIPKVPYQKSIADVLLQSQEQQMTAGFDLCELIFGTLRDYGYSLKSRVTFSDATCTKLTGRSLEKNKVTLLSPRASYLNAYIEQGSKEVSQLTKYEDSARLKGWKRYPSKEIQSLHSTGTDSTDSSFETVKEDSEFTGYIVFNNLKKEELAAIIWALKFEDTVKYCHSLGYGKPYGFGAVQFSNVNFKHIIPNNSDNEIPSIEDLNAFFIKHMNTEHPGTADNSWQNSTQVQHLLSFSDIENNSDKNLTYMPLKPEQGFEGMTYTTSTPNGKKNKITLPNWVSRSGELNRSEKINVSVMPKQISGRLTDLVTRLHYSDSVKSYEKTKYKKIVQAKNKLKEQEKIDKNSNAKNLYLELSDKFKELRRTSLSEENEKEQKQALNGDIERLLTILSEGIPDDMKGDIQHIINSITQESVYLKLVKNRRNKEKLATRKKLIAALEENT